jgi:hypothetical protein
MLPILTADPVKGAGQRQPANKTLRWILAANGNGERKKSRDLDPRSKPGKKHV